MSTSHTPLIRLQAAKRNYEFAAEACPHWDYETEGAEHDCCIALIDAHLELKLARRAMEVQP